MSSHHIIREKQEPALLILDLQEINEDLLGQLLEWSPTLICTTDVYEILYARGIKADVLLQSGEADHHLQEHLQLIKIEENVVKSAFTFLINEAYPAVNIVTNDFSAEIYQPYTTQIDLVILSRHQRIFSIKSGFSKWKPEGERINILSSNVTLIQTSGLRQVKENEFITIQDGFYSLSFNEKSIFISENL